MNVFQKQLILNSGRTLLEEAKIPRPESCLDSSRIDYGEAAPPPKRVSVEEFEATMQQIRRGGESHV